MARRKTDRAVNQLRAIAGVRSGEAPVGYEHYGVDWSRLHPKMRGVVCRFADVLRETRENELALLKLGTIDSIRGLTVELKRLIRDDGIR